MDYEVSTAIGHINKAIEARKAEDHEKARQHLLHAVIKDPENEIGWLWLAEASDDPGERRYCLDSAIQINPESAGRRERANLLWVDSKVPEGIADIYNPPLPPTFRHAHRTSRVNLNRIRRPRLTHLDTANENSTHYRFARTRSWLWIALVALVIINMIAAFMVKSGPISEQHYIAVVAPISGSRC